MPTTVIALDKLDRIERSRETVENVWRGLLVMNSVGLVAMLGLVGYFWAARPERFAEIAIDRPFFESLWMFLIGGVLAVIASVFLLRAAQQLGRVVLLITSILFLAFVVTESAFNVWQLANDASQFRGQPEAEAVAHAAFLAKAFFTLLAVLLYVPLLRTTVAAFRTREVRLLEPAAPKLSGFWLLRLLGWPAHMPSVGRRRMTAFLLFTLASLLYALGFLIGLNNLGVMSGGHSDWLIHARKGVVVSTPYTITGIYALVPLNIVFSLVVILLMTYFSRLVERRAQSRVRLSMEEALGSDSRPPVVFLRAFGDDQVALARSSPGAVARVLDVGNARKRLDHIALEEGFGYGPVVALGRPGDPYPPYGAARGYFEDANWQDVVANLCRQASAVLFCVDDTDGVWWELDHIMSTSAINKTLILLHPKHAAPNANRKMLDLLLERSRTAAATEMHHLVRACRSLSETSPVLGFYQSRQGCVAGTAVRFEHRAYRIMTRAFLRELAGDPAQQLGSAALEPSRVI